MVKVQALCMTDLYGFMKRVDYLRGLCAQVRDEPSGKSLRANKSTDVKTHSRRRCQVHSVDIACSGQCGCA
jgi:hypothetical protein